MWYKCHLPTTSSCFTLAKYIVIPRPVYCLPQISVVFYMKSLISYHQETGHLIRFVCTDLHLIHLIRYDFTTGRLHVLKQALHKVVNKSISYHYSSLDDHFKKKHSSWMNGSTIAMRKHPRMRTNRSDVLYYFRTGIANYLLRDKSL